MSEYYDMPKIWDKLDHSDGSTGWYICNAFAGYNEDGFWKVWRVLTPRQKKDITLISYILNKL